MSGSVVTRFAPSPTGYLHIGGARTALFNWAFARANKGRFLLRIEDTDRARSTDEAIDAIHQGLKWLELEADEPAVFQSQKQERHCEIAHRLLEQGLAYRSYASDEEIEAIRIRAREDGCAARYPGRDEAIDPALHDQSVVRFKAPIEGETVIKDLVQGDVSIRNDQLDDLVLLRSDGTPTYMLAVVVDDHDMGVTHVIRGDDHLTNCARQIQIYEALQWIVPQFAHIPLIHGPDGAKLSKRHGALGAEHYQAMGYLAEGMRNYLSRLGWSHGDDEIIPTEKLVEWFDLSGVNKAPSRFDLDKLNSINAHYLQKLDDEEVIQLLKAMLALDEFDKSFAFNIEDIDYEKLRLALVFLKERSKTLVEVLHASAYLFIKSPVMIEEKAKKSLSAENVTKILFDLKKLFSGSKSWEKTDIEAVLKGYAEEKQLKFGKIAPPLRSVLTGSTVSPGIYDVLYSLGQQESVKRIEDYLG